MKRIRPELSAESLAALRESMWDEAETRGSILRKADDILDKLADFLDAGEEFFDRGCIFLRRVEERRNNDGAHIGQNDD